MRMFVLLAVVVGCKPGPTKPAGPDKAVDQVSLELDGSDHATVEFAVTDKDGATVTSLGNYESVSFSLAPIVNGKPDENSLCRMRVSVAPEAYDAKTKRFHIVDRFDYNYRNDGCRAGLVENKIAPPFDLWISFSGISSHTTISKLVLQDSRPANLPELDAFVAKITPAIQALDATTPLPACTPALTGNHRLAAVERETFLGVTTGFDFATTFWFEDLAQYAHREDAIPAQTLQFIKDSTAALIYVATERKMPIASGDKFSPGVFDGRAIVLDLASGKPTCAVPFTAVSSDSVSTKKTFETRNGESRTTSDDTGHQLNQDFINQFAMAMPAAMAAAGVRRATPDGPSVH